MQDNGLVVLTIRAWDLGSIPSQGKITNVLQEITVHYAIFSIVQSVLIMHKIQPSSAQKSAEDGLLIFPGGPLNFDLP